MSEAVSSQTVKPRPALFRALGREDPPAALTVAGRAYHLATIYKHDSWAATSLYEADVCTGDDADRIVVKINRRQPILLLPMTWLGRRLAVREEVVFERMADVAGVPRWLGRIGPTGIAHVFVPGEPLAPQDTVSSSFLDRLEELVAVFHERQVALVDLQKPENVLRGDDGLPYLLDFQIAWALPRRGIGRWWPMQPLHRIALNSDLYHLRKHRYRFLQHTLSAEELKRLRRRPWYIRAHRLIARPFHGVRRALLVKLGVRDRTGKATTELHAEPGIAKRRRS